MMATDRPKARRMDEEKRLTAIIVRQTQSAINAHRAMLEIKKWLDLDTAGKKFDALKLDARKVMDELDAIALEGAAYLPPSPETGGV